MRIDNNNVKKHLSKRFGIILLLNERMTERTVQKRIAKKRYLQIKRLFIYFNENILRRGALRVERQLRKPAERIMDSLEIRVVKIKKNVSSLVSYNKENKSIVKCFRKFGEKKRIFDIWTF